MGLILLFNFISLIALVTGIRWWQKRHGRLSEKKLALLLIVYFSFFTITPLLPLLRTHPRETIIVDIILLLIWWGIGYPWARWLIRQFTSPKG